MGVQDGHRGDGAAHVLAAGAGSEKVRSRLSARRCHQTAGNRIPDVLGGAARQGEAVADVRGGAGSTDDHSDRGRGQVHETRWNVADRTGTSRRRSVRVQGDGPAGRGTWANRPATRQIVISGSSWRGRVRSRFPTKKNGSRARRARSGSSSGKLGESNG